MRTYNPRDHKRGHYMGNSILFTLNNWNKSLASFIPTLHFHRVTTYFMAIVL